MLTSLIFVVAAFLEFAFVLQLNRLNEKAIHEKKPLMRNEQMTVIDGGPQKENENSSNRCLMNDLNFPVKPVFDVVKIDFVAFNAGLLLFLSFNLVYWLIFSFYKFEE